MQDKRRKPRIPSNDRRIRGASGMPEANGQYSDDAVTTSQDKRLKTTSKKRLAESPEPEKLYGITELADEFGITTRAIRFYEAKKLLNPPRANGARVYTKRERARMMLILRAKSIGFSLAEIKRYLDLYGDRGEGRPLQADFLAERTATLIAELEEKQANIAATLKELRVIRGECLQFLGEAGTKGKTNKKQ
jgi:DNA-binding transcriptional MerR regulator